jgi:hypothetical protein
LTVDKVLGWKEEGFEIPRRDGEEFSTPLLKD